MSSSKLEFLQPPTLSPEFCSKLPTVTSPRICSKVKHTEKLINEIIFHQEIMKDTQKASIKLNEAQLDIEVLFDELKHSKLDMTQVNALTELCRKLNEDPAIQKIREHQFNITNSPQNKHSSPRINPLPISKLGQPSPSGRHSTQSTARSLSEKRLSWSSPAPKIAKETFDTKSLGNVDENLLTDESEETTSAKKHTKRARISLPAKRLSPLKPITSISNMELTLDDECIEISHLQFETSNPRIIIAETSPKSDEKMKDSGSEPIIEVDQTDTGNFLPPEEPQEVKDELKEPERPAIEIKSKRKNFQQEFDEMIEKLNFLYSNHKIDQAHKTLDYLKEFITKPDIYSKEEKSYFETKLQENHLLINDIEMLYPFVAKVISELEDKKGYKTETAKKNLIIQYKDSPQGKTGLKMETTVNAPLANLLSLFYEADGYSTWTPFCNESKEITKIGRSGNAMWLKWSLPPPITNREGYLVGMGYDRFEENGSFLLVSKTINENKDFQERFGIKIPEKSKFVRLEIHYVGVQLTPITKDKTHMKIVNMFDMKLKMVPTSLMNWVVKKGASHLVDKIVGKAGELNGPFWQKKRSENRDFYDWLKGLVDGHLAAHPELK